MTLYRTSRSVLDFATEDDLRQALAVSFAKADEPTTASKWHILAAAKKTKTVDDPTDTIECEVQRLKALLSLAVLDTERDEEVDQLAEELRQCLGASLACVSLVDLGRNWFKSVVKNEVQLSLSETPRKDSFCAHAILEEGELFVVPDALLDARFRENPLVTDAPNFRFYAGAPLMDGDGYKIGALCVLDTKPRTLTTSEERELKAKASDVVQLLAKRRDLAQTVRKRSSSNSAAATNDVFLKSEEEKEPVPKDTNIIRSLKSSTAEPEKHLIASGNGNSSNGKRSRANSPERVSDVIQNPQQQPLRTLKLLPNPKTSSMDPDEFLVELVAAMYHGVQLKVRLSLELEDFFPPISEEQMARYHTQVVNMARANDVAGLKLFHAQHGRDALDCFNRFGEGLLNISCRRGFTDMVKFLFSPAVALDVRVRDDYGRTPLHDACWNPEPQLDICTWIMEKDPSLFLVADKRGFTPFQYARKSDWSIWRQFLVDNLDHLQALTRPEIVAKFS